MCTLKNYTVTQLPVGRLIAHDPATCTHSVTLMEGSKREKQQVVRWDDLLGWYLSFLSFVVHLKFGNICSVAVVVPVYVDDCVTVNSFTGLVNCS